MDSENIMLMLKWTGGIIASVLMVMAGVIRTKVDKKDYEKHCDNSREDKKEMYDKINDMSDKVTEIHTIVKERNK